MDYRVGRMGRTIAIRLNDGEDVYESVHEVARRENVRCAAVIAVGGVRKAKVVVGPKNPNGPIEPDFREFDNARKIVNTNTLFWDDAGPQMHIHMAFGRGDKPLVGCPRGGAHPFCVLAIVMIELADIDAERAFDPEMGLKLLTFGKK